jgi:hypothetical protein
LHLDPLNSNMISLRLILQGGTPFNLYKEKNFK